MPSSSGIRTDVLSEQLQEVIRGRVVKAAVFTTYQFEPGFFEEDVLPLLFEQSFSHVPQIRLIQLEEALLSVEHLAVYYDRRGLRSSGSPARLDVRRIPLERSTGYFHPKLILLLVEEKVDEGEIQKSLIVGVLSANLTRAGWWESVECAWMEEYVDEGRCSIRHDLLELLRLIRDEDRTDDEHAALDVIYKFVRYRVDDESYRSSGTVLHPRLFYGQADCGEFLSDTLRLPADTYNLEVISPYFDETEEAGTLRNLVETLNPKETRVFLPRGDDGVALCCEGFFEAVVSVPRVKWGTLPKAVVQRSSQDDPGQTDRFVHAKVYRLWSRSEEREYILIGSVNLTRAAHGKARAGNVEAAVLIEHEYVDVPRFWLDVEDKERPESFRVENGEEEPAEQAPPPLTLRHSWDRGESEYFWEGTSPPGRFELFTGGSPLGTIAPVAASKWKSFPPELSESLADRLRSTSFVEVSVDGGPRATLLIREEGMAQKPSILMMLSAEEILRYWSLLSVEQRQAFLAGKAQEFMVQEGILAERTDPLRTVDSMFDRFAAIFHAFSMLREHVVAAIEAGREKEAVYRLFGKKYDSLPSLIQTVLGDQGGDVVNRYITLLTAQDTLRQLEKEYAPFFQQHRRERKALHQQLHHVEALKKDFVFGNRELQGEFISWFERMFFTDMRPAD